MVIYKQVYINLVLFFHVKLYYRANIYKFTQISNRQINQYHIIKLYINISYFFKRNILINTLEVFF